ncbi:hypothetical protein SCLCIDRAFT_1214539 [Scleroderma citrinum Foug A]|uniref:Uncharacterized protein n=1 Tax=Scleroderma citrinum Foug A TaxID=1036808 RepID=A0A0C3E4P5_9AGAM|nr:hypothetical protein SCLCIDRAFT_1214539 [Scleroderma citrinum Foug A]
MENASLEPDGTVPLGIRHTPEAITSGDIPHKSLISRPRSVLPPHNRRPSPDL